MSDLRVRALDEDEIGTIIADDVEFDGEMHFEHPVLIRGKVKGSITSLDDVFISEEAVIDADLDAKRISIKGRVTAAINARERLELFKTARIEGPVDTPDLIVQSGARFNGPCTMPAQEEHHDSAE